MSYEHCPHCEPSHYHIAGSRSPRQSNGKMVAMRNDAVIVDHEDDDLQCPKCEGETRKVDYPLRAMADVPKNAENVTDALGLAFCQPCDDTFTWWYRQ